MNIIVFALYVVLNGTEEPTITSYWINQRHCLNDARQLSQRQENYKAVQAWCEPIMVNPQDVKIFGYEVQDE